MCYKNKKLLILAGAPAHIKIIKAAREMGVYTIVTDNIRNSPGKQFADESWDISTTDVQAIVDRCREAHVSGVLNYCIQTAQRPYLEICSLLGLPCYGTRLQFEIMNDKRKFKDLCKQHSIAVVPEYKIDDISGGNVEYPVLVKPTDSRGSRGQSVCYCPQDVFRAIEKAKVESFSGSYLIEKYMTDCLDVALAYMVIDGRPYLVKIGDRYLGSKDDGLDRQQLATVLPSTITPLYLDSVHNKVCSMIRRLGVQYGPVFLQGFWRNGEMYMYDPALRFPGTDFDVVQKAATGFDSISSLIRFSLTGDCKSCYGNPVDSYFYKNGACVIFSVSAHEGRIVDIEGFDEVCNDKRVLSGVLLRSAGDIIQKTGDIRQRVAEFVGYVNSRDEVGDFRDFILDRFFIVGCGGRDMRIVSDFEN